VIVNIDTENPEQIPVRDAATVMLVRDGSTGVEVFMLRRNLNSDFVGGAYVFPGGAVDPEDGSPDVDELCEGLTDETASGVLGVERGGLSYWVAAIRESFEEAGLLLALDGDGKMVSFADNETNERFVEHRRQVDAGERSLTSVARAEGLRLATGGIHYFSRWITPLGAPRRYDTRFFVAHPPEEQVPVHDDHEVIANLWIRPGDALERHGRGEFELIFPTVRSLEALTRFETADAVVRHAAEVATIDPILPTIVDSDHGLRIVLPDDEVYDAVTSKRILPG
jgi:8-oxo-dGTP pyrophosphatase MutT (NUDIX family)